MFSKKQKDSLEVKQLRNAIKETQLEHKKIKENPPGITMSNADNFDSNSDHKSS